MYPQHIITNLQYLEHPSMFNINTPAFWEKAKGSRVYGEGRVWIDFTSSIAVANAGHANPKVVRAVRRELKKGLTTTYTFPHRKRLELYNKMRSLLLDSTGEFYKFHFVSSGTEAVEGAIDIAREYCNINPFVVLSFTNAFHGNTQKAAAMSGDSGINIFKDEVGEIYYIKVTYAGRQSDYRYLFKDTVKRALERHGLSAEAVGCVLIEPYQGRGVTGPSPEFIADVANFCKRSGALLIVDEVQSGFYRTGLRFAFEHFNLVPDIVVVGKGLTSSLPMSGVAVKDVIFNKTEKLDIASTHSANPLASVAALANIDFLEKYHKKHHNDLYDILDKSLREIHLEFSDIVSYSESFGLVGALRFSCNTVPSEQIATVVVRECFKNGLLVTGPNGPEHAFILITPPLIINKADLMRGLGILKKSIKKARHY